MDKKITEQFGDLSLIDIMYSEPEGDCAVLVLITVGYINGTPETQTNLLDKLEGYLKHIQSNEFKQDYPQSTIYIDIKFEEMPHPLILDLLYKCQSWCNENGATQRILIGENYVHFKE